MQAINFIQVKNLISSEKTESTKTQQRAYADKHKLIRDSSSLHGGKGRPLYGDFFSPVLYAPSVLSGVHRIQQAQAEYMHRFHEARRTPAYFVQILRKHGATPMLTAHTGESRPNTAPQLRLPSFPIGHFPKVPRPLLNKTQPTPKPEAETIAHSHTIEFFPMGSSTLCTQGAELVAWIHEGYAGSRNNPGACTFYDVAFPSPTLGQQKRVTGMVLDSTCFDSLADAVQFVEATFANGGEA